MCRIKRAVATSTRTPRSERKKSAILFPISRNRLDSLDTTTTRGRTDSEPRTCAANWNGNDQTGVAPALLPVLAPSSRTPRHREKYLHPARRSACRGPQCLCHTNRFTDASVIRQRRLSFFIGKSQPDAFACSGGRHAITSAIACAGSELSCRSAPNRSGASPQAIILLLLMQAARRASRARRRFWSSVSGLPAPFNRDRDTASTDNRECQWSSRCAFFLAD